MDLLLEADPSEKLIAKYLPESKVFVIGEGQIRAIMVLTPLSVDQLEVKNLSVTEEDQGKGLGTHLIRFAIDHSKQLGYDQLIIGTGNTSTGQLKLYERLGFVRFGIKEDFFSLHYEQKIFENGIECRHMIMLEYDLNNEH